MCEEMCMNAHKIVKRNYAGLILAVVVLSLFTQAPVSHGAGPLLTWPVVDGGEIRSRPLESLKPHEVRKGRIALTPQILPRLAGAMDQQIGINISNGDTNTASISLFADVVYEVIINSVKHHTDGTMIISGKLKDHTMGTVVITIGPDGFLITVQDMNRSLLYRAAGDSRQGSGSVTEIDMNKMPPMVR
jgi:hypothetical protein